MIAFVVGFIIGFILGFTVLALMVVGKVSRERYELDTANVYLERIAEALQECRERGSKYIAVWKVQEALDEHHHDRMG